MNSKLTEGEYQQMVMMLLELSLSNIEDLEQNDDPEYTDWIFFLKKIQNKGVRGDLSRLVGSYSGKPKLVAKKIMATWIGDSKKDITTRI